MNILLVLLFFPSISFNLLPAEIFPWGILLIPYFLKKRLDNILLYIITGFIYISLFVALKNSTVVGEVVRSSAAYLNVLAIFYYVLVSDSEKTDSLLKMAKKIYIIMIIIGIVQYFNLIAFLNPLFSMLISRGSASLFSGGGRGVSILSTEPSRAGIELVCLYTLFRKTLLKNKAVYDTANFVYLIFIIRSATSLMLFMLFIMFEYRKVLLKNIFVIALSVALLSFAAIKYSNIRALNVVLGILQSKSIEDIWLFLINASGFRLISIVGAYIFGILYPFGMGIGMWQESSLEALNLTGYNPANISFFRTHKDSMFAPIRPTSFIANLMLDVGIIGVIAFLTYLYRLVKKYTIFSESDMSIVFLFLFSIFLLGAVGDPTIWIVLAIIGRKNFWLEKEEISSILFDNLGDEFAS